MSLLGLLFIFSIIDIGFDSSLIAVVFIFSIIQKMLCSWEVLSHAQPYQVTGSALQVLWKSSPCLLLTWTYSYLSYNLCEIQYWTSPCCFINDAKTSLQHTCFLSTLCSLIQLTASVGASDECTECMHDPKGSYREYETTETMSFDKKGT